MQGAIELPSQTSWDCLSDTVQMAQAPSMPHVNELAREAQCGEKRQCSDTPIADFADYKKKLKMTQHSPLESLPPDVFCKVLSLVGPTSDSLVVLSEVNLNFNNKMKLVSEVMLPRATSNFRAPLEPKSPLESSTSLFLRHARTCANILTKMAVLRNLLQNRTHLDVPSTEKAMSMALHLLEVGPTLSLSLERQILSVCGKCGGHAFKLSKQVLLQCISNPSSGASRSSLQEEHAKNQERLDMSRLIMQTVLFRNFQLAKTTTSFETLTAAKFVQDQLMMKKVSSMGCH